MANFWFALDVGAYNKKTAHLTLLEHGVYFALMRHYYATGEPLPSEASRLQRICRAHSDEELKAISFIIASFFTLKRDTYHNERCDEEIRKAKEVSKLRGELGRKGGLAKAKAKAVASEVANDLAKSYTVTDTVTYTNTKEKTSSTAEIGIDAATQKVFLEVGLAGNEARMLCHDSVNAFVHLRKCSFEQAADSLVEIWQRYDSTEIDFKKGVFKFFKEGLWKTPESWGKKSGDKWEKFMEAKA